jgi:hypothetical protein
MFFGRKKLVILCPRYVLVRLGGGWVWASLSGFFRFFLFTLVVWVLVCILLLLSGWLLVLLVLEFSIVVSWLVVVGGGMGAVGGDCDPFRRLLPFLCIVSRSVVVVGGWVLSSWE